VDERTFMVTALASSGRGLGSRLLDVAKSVYPEGLDLWAFPANTGARRFYERHGFVAIAWTEGDNEEGAPVVRYHWQAADAERAQRPSKGAA
jgi:GNAT superfamily N-acetyltransferase